LEIREILDNLKQSEDWYGFKDHCDIPAIFHMGAVPKGWTLL
jgi:hypothetical protein